MKHIFFITLLCASLSVCSMAENIPLKVVGKAPSNTTATPVKIGENSRAVKKLQSNSTTQVSATFTLDEGGFQYVYACIAVPSDATEEGYYNSQKIDETTFNFALPAGNYDFMTIIDEEEAAKRVILTKEDITVSSDKKSINFDVADAKYSTRISHTDSEGNVLTLPSYTEPHNCTCADFIDLVTHNGILAWVGETLAYMECNYILSTNAPESRFSFLRSDIIGAEIESASMLIPIDFTKEVCGPTSSDGWQVAYDDFVTTPFIQSYDSYIESLGVESNFTYLVRGLVLNGNWWGATGLGVFDMSCNSKQVAIWAPENYNEVLDVMICQSSNVFSGDDSSIQGMFLMRGEHGLTQVGLNMPMADRGNIFACTADSQSITRQFSRFSGIPQGGIRGNATPLLMASTAPTRFFYTYKGRYGEDLSLDSYDILNSMDNEDLLAQFGGNPSTIKIYADGELICASRHDLPYYVNWIEGAENRAEIEMRNVLIDNKIPGCNTATIVWNAEKGNGFAPTFTSLQFRDTEDNICDRFNDASDGVVEFTVGDMVLDMNYEEQYLYFDIDEVGSVSVAYAPHGNTDFSPISVKEIPELFFTPGYGYFYRGSLGIVDRKSDDGWFDLRLRAEDKDGAYIEQTISPAFYISAMTGIEKINYNSELEYEIVGNDIIVSPDVKIFTTDGKDCSGKNLARGVYIISNGSKVCKIMI